MYLGSFALGAEQVAMAGIRNTITIKNRLYFPPIDPPPVVIPLLELQLPGWAEGESPLELAVDSRERSEVVCGYIPLSRHPQMIIPIHETRC